MCIFLFFFYLMKALGTYTTRIYVQTNVHISSCVGKRVKNIQQCMTNQKSYFLVHINILCLYRQLLWIKYNYINKISAFYTICVNNVSQHFTPLLYIFAMAFIFYVQVNTHPHTHTQFCMCVLFATKSPLNTHFPGKNNKIQQQQITKYVCRLLSTFCLLFSLI